MSHILWSFRRCPYAMRARMALHLAGFEYEHREVSLRNKPDALLKASAKATVPVMVLSDGSVLKESLEIMRWALPDVPIQSEYTDAIDGPFKHHLDRYKYKSRYDETAERGDVDFNHRQQAIETLQKFDSRLSGSRFLDDDAPYLTDIACFPFIRQFAATEADWWIGQDYLPHVRDWLSGWLASDLFKSIMMKHPLWAPELTPKTA